MYEIHTTPLKNTEYNMDYHNSGQTNNLRVASTKVKGIMKAAGVLSLAFVTSSAIMIPPVKIVLDNIESEKKLQNKMMGIGSSLFINSNEFAYTTNNEGYTVFKASFYGNSEEALGMDNTNDLRFDEMTSAEYTFEARAKKRFPLPNRLVVKENVTPDFHLASNELINDDLITLNPRETFKL